MSDSRKNNVRNRRISRPGEKSKKQRKFGAKMQANLLLVFCVVVFLFVVMIIRIIYLNQDKGQKYEKRILSQQTYVSNPIPYKRGTIMDRNETVFAKSERVYNVVLSPKEILEDEQYQEPTLNAVNSFFGISIEEMKQVITEKPESQYVIIKKEVDYDNVTEFKEYNKKKENASVKGVWFEEQYKRIYPLKQVASDVIGFTNSKGAEGIGGIEGYYNDELSGSNGREYGYFDADMNLQRTVKPAENGSTVVLSLDANVQEIVEQCVAQFNETQGSEETAAIVMNPQTFEIYAMTSGPLYDLNNPWDLTSFIKKAELNKMTDKEKEDYRNEKLWRNYCISDAFEPGSTFKPFTIAAGLEEAVIRENTVFTCTGVTNVAGTDIHCNKLSGHGSLTLPQSLMQSCNSALMQVGDKLGRVEFDKYQEIFNLGAKTGIDLPGETQGLVYHQDRLNATELATSSFGQSLTVNMLHIACGLSSLINGGNYYQPHLVRSIRNDSNAVIKNVEPVLVRQTVSSQTSDLIRKFMYETVEEGTAKTAQIPGYEIGGKTGTAERIPRDTGGYVVSFVGFTPIDNPQVLVYVVVDQPDTHTDNLQDQAHASFAIGVCRDIMTKILPFLGVYSEDAGTSQPAATVKPEQTQEPEATPEPSAEELSEPQ